MHTGSNPTESTAALAAAWTQFLSRYPWRLFLTLTHRSYNTKPDKARRAVRLMIARCNDELYGPRWYRRNQGLIWVLANETTKLGALHHHMLLGGDRVEDLDCKMIENIWSSLAGIGKVERIRSTRRVCRYVSKYCSKGEIELSESVEAFQRR